MEKKITKIPATIGKYTSKPINSRAKLKVACYARVSTDHEEQQTSYEAQVDYYTNYIKGRGDWEFAGVYTDEGISATSTKRRDGFNTMIADALSGKIDLIITKSVSRFARNTVDSLTTIRKLKEHNIECYFEKENIWTFDGKGELLITLMSSLAQEESRSISENVTWGQRKRFADGKVSFAYSRVLGFDKGENGQIAVNQKEAETVRLIFKLFLEGMTPHTIAVKLTEMGIKSPIGKDKWNRGTIRRMLSNEKYKGDALLQKEFTVDFLSKKMKKNEGEVPQYYIEGNHEAIISPQVFDLVQGELERRKREKGTRYSGVSIFSNKIKCADCGGWYGSKVWHSTDKYRRVIYRCNSKYNGAKCETPHLTEEEIKGMFVNAYNKLLTEKKEIIANVELMRKTLFNTDDLETERDKLQEDMKILVDMTHNIVAENARIIQNQDEYQKRYDGLVQRYEKAKSQYDEVVYRIEQKETQSEKMRLFIKTLKEQDGIINDFDGALWSSTVAFITVGKEEKTVTFKDGTEIRI